MVRAKNSVGPLLVSLKAKRYEDPKSRGKIIKFSAAHPPLLALPLVEPDARPIESSGRAAGVLSTREATDGRRPRPIPDFKGPINSSLRG